MSRAACPECGGRVAVVIDMRRGVKGASSAIACIGGGSPGRCGWHSPQIPAARTDLVAAAAHDLEAIAAARGRPGAPTEGACAMVHPSMPAAPADPTIAVRRSELLRIATYAADGHAAALRISRGEGGRGDLEIARVGLAVVKTDVGRIVREALGSEVVAGPRATPAGRKGV